MDPALIAVISGVGGAAIGVLGTFFATRAQMRADRRRHLSEVALELAKIEVERHPDSEHSVAAHWKVFESLLLDDDTFVDPADPEALRAAHQRLTDTHMLQCLSNHAGDTIREVSTAWTRFASQAGDRIPPGPSLIDVPSVRRSQQVVQSVRDAAQPARTRPRPAPQASSRTNSTNRSRKGRR